MLLKKFKKFPFLIIAIFLMVMYEKEIFVFMKKIVVSSLFEKSLKKLAKRFPSIKKIFQECLNDLQSQQNLGEEISGHQNYFKIRYGNPDAKRGKSGGFRIIYLNSAEKFVIILIDIYSKTDQEEVSWDKVKSLKEEINDFEGEESNES